MSKTMNTYFNPVNTYCGFDRLQDVKRILHEQGGKSDAVLLMTRGSNFVGSEEERTLLEQLNDRQVFRYDVSISNPDVEDLYRVVQDTAGFDFDLVLAVGGGSVLDVAKSVCALRGMEVDGTAQLRDVIIGKSYRDNPGKCPWIGVPTTAGTGSEVTSWATVWDRERNVKYSIDGKDLYAVAAIIDPRLTMNLPIRLTVTSALDAICHATESYWSVRTNPVSRMFALTAIERIVRHIETLVDDPLHETAREQIALGSFFAGMAFSNTATTACHALSYPITLKFGVDHGIAVSVTLSAMLERNEPYIVEREILYRAFGAVDRHGVDETVKRVYRKAGLLQRLRDYGVREADLGDIAVSALAHGRMGNNPVPLTKEQAVQVLSAVY